MINKKNIVIIRGKLSWDNQPKTSANGIEFLTNQVWYSNPQKEGQEKTFTLIPFIIFDNKYNILTRFMNNVKKGTEIQLIGKLISKQNNQEYTKDGMTKSFVKTEITFVVSDFIVLQQLNYDNNNFSQTNTNGQETFTEDIEWE